MHDIIIDLLQHQLLPAVAHRQEDPGPRPTQSLKELSRHFSRKYDQLVLVCQAMWELLAEQTSLSEEDLRAKVNELDLRDGRRDGRLNRRVTTPLPTCPECGAGISRKFNRCMLCGYEGDVTQTDPFDQL